MAVWSIVPRPQVGPSRLDAEYFHPIYLNAEEAVRSVDHRLLAELAGYIKRGVQPEYDQFGSIPVIRSVNVQPAALSTSRQAFVTPGFFVSNPRGQVGLGDVLVNSTGLGTLGRAAYVTTDTHYFVDGHVTVIRDLADTIDPFYLVVFLLSELGQQQLHRRQRGSSGQVELYPDDIAEIAVPIPPAALLESITTIGERRIDLITDAANCQAQAVELIAEILRLDSIRLPTAKTYAATLKEVVTADRLDAEHFNRQNVFSREYLVRGFSGAELGSIGRVLKGITPTEYVEIGIPVVRSGDLGDLDSSADLLRADPSSVRFYLEYGDVLMSSIGMGSIGKVEVFDSPTPHTTVSEVTVVRQHHLEPHFLKAFLETFLGQVQILSWVTGATGQLHLRPTDVTKVVVPTAVPSEIQKKFAELHQQARTLREEAQELLEEAKRRMEALVHGG